MCTFDISLSLFDLPIEISSRSRNRLTFKMDNKLVSAEADLTVFNLKSFIRLAVVQVCGLVEIFILINSLSFI